MASSVEFVCLRRGGPEDRPGRGLLPTVPPVLVTDFHEETARGMKVERPGPISSAIALVEAGLRPTRAARQLGIGRSTLYRAIAERKAA